MKALWITVVLLQWLASGISLTVIFCRHKFLVNHTVAHWQCLLECATVPCQSPFWIGSTVDRNEIWKHCGFKKKLKSIDAQSTVWDIFKFGGIMVCHLEFQIKTFNFDSTINMYDKPSSSVYSELVQYVCGFPNFLSRSLTRLDTTTAFPSTVLFHDFKNCILLAMPLVLSDLL